MSSSSTVANDSGIFVTHFNCHTFQFSIFSVLPGLQRRLIQRGLKREGVSLWFLAAHRAAEAKLGLLSLTSNPPSPSSPAVQKRFSGPLRIPRSSSRNCPLGDKHRGRMERRSLHKGSAAALGHSMGLKESVGWHLRLQISPIRATERFLVRAHRWLISLMPANSLLQDIPPWSHVIHYLLWNLKYIHLSSGMEFSSRRNKVPCCRSVYFRCERFCLWNSGYKIGPTWLLLCSFQTVFVHNQTRNRQVWNQKGNI